MSSERSILVAVEGSPNVVQLVTDIQSAAVRAEKADPGDRTDILRYESLNVQLEVIAAAAISNGAAYERAEEPLHDGDGFSFHYGRGEPSRHVGGDGLINRLPPSLHPKQRRGQKPVMS